MFKWLKNNWGKSIIFVILGYALHLVIEGFIVTQVAALFGYTIPVIV
jgi:hypothetical protein